MILGVYVTFNVVRPMKANYLYLYLYTCILVLVLVANIYKGVVAKIALSPVGRIV